MIQEVVNKIIEAEQAAKQIAEQAQEKANNIIIAAYSSAEELNLHSREENKQYVKQCALSAAKQAEQAKLAYVAEQALADEKILATARKNTAKALKYVLENL